MKKAFALLLLSVAAPGWADPAMVYRQVPPQCRLVQMGERRIIQDCNGFFMGYYQPAPPPATFVPTVRRGSSGGSSMRGYSPHSQGYGYGYNGYGYGYNGYGYGYQGYGQCPSPYSPNGSYPGLTGGYPGQCPSASTPSHSSPQPLTQSGWFVFPDVTRSGF